MTNTENKYVIGVADSLDFKILSKVAKSITPLFSQSYIITLKDTIVAKQTLNHFDRRKIPVKTIGDVEIIFTGEVLLKPKTEYGIQPIIAFSNGILSIKEYTAYNTYVMNVSNWDSLFYISNKVYESGMVEYCHPNFIVPVDLNYDPLYESQYYLNNPNNIDINAPDAWLLANNATTYGRNGKGSIVVFSSGNDNQSYSGVSFPANVAGVIAVGAINANTGIIQNYSGRGPELSLVAPSGTNTNDMVTCDRMGSLGYNTENNGHYTNEFGGTLAACPQVSGVAALMLSVNPNLTSQEVTSILQTTARDLGTPGFDNTYGYGLVDAHKAVVYAMEYGYNLAILGDSTLSDCDNKTYTCDILHPELFTYEWSATPNLSIISDNNSSIAVIPVNTGVGTITVDVYQQGRLMYTLTKSVNVTSVWTGITPVSTVPFHVSSNITWSSKVFLPVLVTIDSFATLTIADTVYCTPASRIIVRPGGKLIVDGGTLTSACAGEMWQGIYVEGHRNLHQTAANQGTVQLLHGAVIENALCGITTAIPPQGEFTRLTLEVPPQSGGMVVTTNTVL